jgi:ribosomal protein S21
MAINVQVTRNNNESGISTIRRFSKRVQEASILTRVRSLRYRQRPPSKFIKKKHALKMLARREQLRELAKLGKIPEKTTRKRRTW